MYLDTRFSFDPNQFISYLRANDDPDLDYFMDMVSIVAELKTKGTKICEGALVHLMSFTYHVRPIVSGLAVLGSGELILHCGTIRMKFSKDDSNMLPIWSVEGATA